VAISTKQPFVSTGLVSVGRLWVKSIAVGGWLCRVRSGVRWAGSMRRCQWFVYTLLVARFDNAAIPAFHAMKRTVRSCIVDEHSRLEPAW
jgi:hypothetical protein